MNLNIPKISSTMEHIDYSLYFTTYPLMTNYAYIKGGIAKQVLLENTYTNYWCSNTIELYDYYSDNEITYQQKSDKPYYTHANDKLISVRPTIDYDYILNHGKCIQNIKDKMIYYKCYEGSVNYKIYQYGEYPQTIVNEKESNELEELYKKDSLSKTKNSYSYVSSINGNKITYAKDDEYIHNGEKFIRAKITSDDFYIQMDYKNLIYDNEYIWIKVEPICWIVDDENKMAITEKVISGPHPYNDIPKNGIEDTLIEKYIKQLSKEIRIDKKTQKIESNFFANIEKWEEWSHEKNIHPVIHMFMINTNGEYLKENVDWEIVSNHLYKTNDIYSLNEILNEETYNAICNLYQSINITIDDVLIGNTNTANLNNIKKYLLINLLTLIDEINYEYVCNFIEKNLGKKYLKYYEMISKHCLNRKEELYNQLQFTTR